MAGSNTARRFANLAVFAVLAWLSACAAGVGNLKAGQVVAGRVALAGATFPLPPGPWRIVYAQTTVDTQQGSFNEQTPMILLVQAQGGSAR